MKEATSNLSSGVVVAISIAVLIAFFSFQIWPTIKGSFERSVACDKAKCTTTPDKDGMVDCELENGNGGQFKCPFKG